MTGTSEAEPRWQRSSRCEGGQCVEMAVVGDGAVALRDSKNPHGPVLVFSGPVWAQFLATLRAGGLTR